MEEPMDSGGRRFAFDFFSAILLWVIALAGAWLPKHLSKRDGKNTAMMYSLGNMLSAGVMLSAGFVHLLGEALNLLQEYRYPIAPFLCACGFCITLIADTAVEVVAGGRGEGHTAHGHCEIERDIFNELVEGPHAIIGGEVQRAATRARTSTDRANGRSASPSVTDLEALGNDSDSLLCDHPEKSDKKNDGAGCIGMAGGPHVHGTGHAHGAGAGGRSVSFITAIFLAAALSLHSVLEGMALGAQAHVSASEDILIAIAAHKGLAAYALGSSVIDSNPTDRRFWTVIASFSLATPVGIFLGYGLAELTSQTTGAALSALASGTFIYVATMEVIPKELGTPDYKVMKMMMMLLGFGAMSLLAIWA